MRDTAAPDKPAPQAHSGDGRDAIRATELVISYVLRGGVLLSGGIILVGVTIFYLRFGSDPSPAQAGQVNPRSLATVLRGAAQGSPLALVMVGLLLLLVTPVVRVLVSIVAFAIERDWRYVGITVLVFAILVVSFLLGKGGA